MSPTLEMSAVALRIGDVDCVRSLSLVVEPGEMVAVTGRSGAGKSKPDQSGRWPTTSERRRYPSLWYQPGWTLREQAGPATA